MKSFLTRWMGAGLTFALLAGTPDVHANVLEGWFFKSKITFQGYSKNETLTNFPVLVKLDPDAIADFSYAQFQSSLGDDLRFADSNETTELDYEIESWDTNGTSFVWVQVPAIAGTNSVIYAYWGKSGVPAAPSTTNGGVWNPTDLAVYHFGATNGAPDARDFTVNRRHAAVLGTTNVAAGMIGGAQGLSGTTYLQGPTNMIGYGVSTSFTLTAWVRPTAGGNQILMADGSSYLNAYGYMLINPPSQIGYGLRTGTTTVGTDTVPAPCTTNQWHMVAQRYDGASVQVFFDGVWKHTTAKSGTIFTGISALYLGRRGDGLYVKGAMDEVRISSAPASSNWIWAAWLNAASNAVFQSYGPAEPQMPMIVNLPPTYTNLTSVYLNGRLDSAGRTGVAVSVYWGDTEGGEPLSGLWQKTNAWAFGTWAGGASPSHLATGLLANTPYFYRFYAANEEGASWPTQSQAFLIADVWVETPDASASEDGDPGVFAIKRGPAGAGTELTVNYTLGGTAPFGSHYTVSPEGRSVILPAGVDTTNITVNPIWDGFREGDQTVELALAPGDYVGVEPVTGLVTITDAVITVGVNETESAGDWEVADNWSLGRIPVVGDEAIVRHAMTLAASTYALASCVVSNGGAITFSGWTTRLQTTNVTVGSGGSLTLPGPFTNNSPSNRIWIVCTNFMLASNGTINVDYKGYCGGTNIIGPGWTNTLAAQGPGAGSGQCGAGYGGRGGSTLGFNQGGIGPAYGSPASPEEPGSGGARNVTAGGSGGGAVRIEASGTATLFGTVTANGGNGLGGGDGGGSGGSIVIGCGQLSGSTNGLLRAQGGVGNDTAGGGGGGRIAVIYAVNPALNPGVRFKVTEGLTSNRGYNGQPGTLYLPNAALLTETLSTNQFIDTRLYLGVPAWTVNTLTASGCKLIFAGDGFRLNVSNDVRVQTASRFGFGDPASTGMTLAIGGSLIVTNGGTFYVYGGITSGVAPDYGCLVSVSNDILLATNASKIFPVSHYTNGGSVLFRARHLTIPRGCAILGDGAGWGTGMGPGKGLGVGHSAGGGGYGGKGGAGGYGGAGGGVYGLTNIPIAPGSGGGIGGGYGNFGGGAVRVELSGKAEINGTISVNGGVALDNYGAGSGGGILLACHSLLGGTNGLLSAKGGDGATRGGGGGGGRIAVAVGLSESDRAQWLANEPLGKLIVSTNDARFQGQALINGGSAGTDKGSNGVPGTVVFLRKLYSGSLILVR